MSTDRLVTTDLASVVLWMTLLAILIAIGIYAIGKFRGELTQDSAPASELLTNFRELHSEGTVSDEEYRTIKATLAERLERELKDNSKTA